MFETNHHSVTVLDFEKVNAKVCFVKVEGYDAELGREFEGVIKLLNGIPFGDLIHPTRSKLSSDCRTTVRGYILNKYANGDFE